MPDEFSVSDMERRKRGSVRGVEAAGFSVAGAPAAGSLVDRGQVPFTHVGLSSTEGVDPLQYVRVLQRRWLCVAVLASAFVGLGLAYVRWWPRTYATTGQYRVDVPGMLILEGGTDRKRLQRIAELIRSQEVLGRVSRQMDGGARWGAGRLRGVLSTRINADAGFLTLTATDQSQERLQEVVGTAARVFNAYVQEEQYDKRHAHLTDSIRKKRKLLDLIREHVKHIRQLDALEGRLRTVALNLTTEREILKKIDAKLDLIGRARPLSSPAALRLIEEETARLRIQRHELSKKYKPGHPKMQDLATRMEALEEIRNIYASEAGSREPRLKAEALIALRFQKDLQYDKLDREERDLEKRRSVLEKSKTGIEREIAAAEREVRLLGLAAPEVLREEEAPEEEEAAGSLPLTPEALAESLASDLDRLNRTFRERGHDVLVPIRAPGNAAQIWPRRMRVLALFLLAGLASGVALAFLIDHLDDRILTPTTVMRGLGINLLVIAPRFRDVRERLIDSESPSSTLAEIFGILRNNIRYTSEANPQKLLLISSAQQGEGKSMVAANLALSYQLEGNSVLLVDADLRRPTGHRLLEGLIRTPDPQPGLRQWLEGETAESTKIIHDTSVESLYVIPAGGRARNPAKLLGSVRMAQVLASVQNEFDVVIIDGPAVLPVVDATVISNQVRGVLLVVSARESRLPSVRHAMGRLNHVGSPIIGAILNKFEGPSSVYSHYYGYGYRGYQYSYSPYRET